MRAARHAGKKPDNMPVTAETKSERHTMPGDSTAGMAFCISQVAGQIGRAHV